MNPTRFQTLVLVFSRIVGFFMLCISTLILIAQVTQRKQILASEGLITYAFGWFMWSLLTGAGIVAAHGGFARALLGFVKDYQEGLGGDKQREKTTAPK
jgi:hypothetical protein